MGKLLFWLLVILAVLLVARIAGRHAAAKRSGSRSAPAQPMVQCAHCGVHLPARDAVRRRGFNYCGLAHSLRGKR